MQKLRTKIDAARRAARGPNSLRGFTLLETIVALAVILAAVVGPVSLVTRGVFNFPFVKNKIVAANLAQEGIELIRAIRENNVACDLLNGPSIGWPWNEDPEPPYPPAGHTFRNTTVGVDADNIITTSCNGLTGVSMVMPRLSTSCTTNLRFNSLNGHYGYSGDQETIFKRCVTIKIPPQDPDTDVNPTAQMDVISVVSWEDRGVGRNVTLKDRLYNWK